MKPVIRALVLASVASALLVVASAAGAQTATPSPSPTQGGPVLPASTTAVVLVVVASVAIFAAWIVPLTVDARRAYRAQREAWRSIIAKLEEGAARGQEGLTVEDLRVFMPIAVRPPEGMRGLSRVLIAFLVLSIVAVITLALMFSSAAGVFDVIKQVVTALLGVLATIIGFYFGARTAEGAAAGTHAATAGAAPPDGEPPEDASAEAERAMPEVQPM